MRKIAIWLCLVSIWGASLSFSPTYAQDDVPPEHIYYVADGYLYEWNIDTDEVTQLTDTGYIRVLHHAPVGRQIAFNWHTSRKPVAGGYEVGDDFTGADVYILEGGQLRNLTNQPDTVRSELAWNSTGDSLTWWQADITQSEDSAFEELHDAKLIFYNVKEMYGYDIGSYQGGVDAGMYYIPQPFYFGNQAYAILSYGAGAEIRLSAYDNWATGAGQKGIVVSSWDMAGRVELFDVQSTSGSYLGLYYEDYGQWDLLNPITYMSEPLTDSTAELRADMPDSLRWRYNPAQGQWELYSVDSNPLVKFDGHILSPTVAVNSDGTGAVYATADALNVVFDDGLTRKLPVEGVQSVVWGSQVWHVAEGITMPTITPENASLMNSDCGVTRLEIGMTGTLNSPYGNELYKHVQPLRFVTGNLPVGTQVTLLDGPLCSTGLPDRRYWQVEAYGISGWLLLSDWALELE